MKRKKSWLGAAAEVQRGEWAFAISMALTFFLVITSFWIMKPLKKGIFIEFYDEAGVALLGMQLDAAQAELFAKVLNMVVAGFAMVAFGVLSRRLRREKLVLAFTALFLAGYAVFAARLSDPGSLSVWSFYLYGDLFTTLMVASFFAFLNDSVSEGAAKRLYGLVGLGGVVGGMVGAMFLAAWIEDLDATHWMAVCGGLGLAIAASTAAAGSFARRLPAESRSRPSPAEEAPAETRSAFAGAVLTLRSRHLLSIAAIVAIYEIVSTAMDFQFTSSVQHFLDGDEIGTHFSRVYAITNTGALLVQLFFTSWIMTRFGVAAALLVLPAAVIGGSSVFLALPTLWTGSLLNTVDGAFAYSLNQSAKEALYVPTTAEEKYQAKAFIDMWVQRAAKAVAVLLSLGVTVMVRDFDGVRWLSLATIALLVVWIPAARFAGRRFDAASEDRARAAREAA